MSRVEGRSDKYLAGVQFRSDAGGLRLPDSGDSNVEVWVGRTEMENRGFAFVTSSPGFSRPIACDVLVSCLYQRIALRARRKHVAVRTSNFV